MCSSSSAQGFFTWEVGLELKSRRPVFVSRFHHLLAIIWKIYSISAILGSLHMYNEDNNSCSILVLLEFNELRLIKHST